MSELARALLPIAHRTLALPAGASVIDSSLLRSVYDALDGFLAEPVASRYLGAVRALGALSRVRRCSAQIDRLAQRSLAAELDRLDQLSLIDVPTEALRSLTPDPGAGRRIQALAALLQAHQAIAQRVRAPERLRAKLEIQPEAAPRRPTRRGERRRR